MPDFIKLFILALVDASSLKLIIKRFTKFAGNTSHLIDVESPGLKLDWCYVISLFSTKVLKKFLENKSFKNLTTTREQEDSENVNADKHSSVT